MRRFIKPVLVTIGAASAAFLIANHGSPIDAAPAAKAKTITICAPEEEPEEVTAQIVELPGLPSIPLPSLGDLAGLIPCIPNPLADLEQVIGSLPPVTFPTVGIPTIRIPQLIPPIPPIPELGFEGFPGFPDCGNQEIGQSVIQFELCPPDNED